MKNRILPKERKVLNFELIKSLELNLYYRKQVWKISLLLLALTVGALSLLYTNRLVKAIATEERERIELWAEATRELATIEDTETDFSFILKVIQTNETIPVIVTGEGGTILYHRNLDKQRSTDSLYLYKRLQTMKAENEPIELELDEEQVQYIFYGDSFILKLLIYYPFLQLLVALLFIVIAYLAFSASRKAEQNQVWLGLSKETAHQLGTPTSSLMALAELLREQQIDPQTQLELEKDVQRLEKITDRFSKIGSKPVLEQVNLVEVIENGIEYIRKRFSREVSIKLVSPKSEILIPLNVSLFDWVIENLCKNAADSIEGAGNISIVIKENPGMVHVDVSDDGKGMPRALFKTVFKPGFTTKNKGWGLGLSLSKRIIEMYHGGKIFVLGSEQNVKTTIRIILYK
jgi:signal transduction histidine kinase